MPRRPTGAPSDGEDTRASSFTQRASFALLRRFSVSGVSGNLKQGTIMGVVLNTLCNVMGAGILSLPLAMHSASILLGTILLVLSSVVSAFAAYMVACGCDATGKESFAEVLAYSLWPETQMATDGPMEGNKIHSIGEAEEEQARMEMQAHEARRRQYRRYVLVVLEIIVFLNNFGALIIYSRVIADSIPPVIANFLDADGIWVEKATWYLISGAVFFALTCVRSMEELKWTSLLGFITIAYIVVLVFVRFFTYGPEGRAPRSDVRYFDVSSDVLRAMSSYGVAWGYHYNIPYFYKELRDGTPKALMVSVSIAFPIIFTSYAIVGIMGYIIFGSEISEHGGDIINNFRNDDVAANVGRLGLFFHFACVFPVLSVCARRGLHRLFMISLQHVAGSTIVAHIKNLTSKPAVSPSEADPLCDTSDGAIRYMEPNVPTMVSPEEVDEEPGRPEDTTRFAIIVEAAVIVTSSVFLAVIVSGIDFVIDIIGTLFGITLMMIVPGCIGMCTYQWSLKPATTYNSGERDYSARTFSYFTSGGEDGGHRFQQVSPTLAFVSRVMVALGILIVATGMTMLIVNS